MQAQAIRQAFLDFFKSREHQIVPSAPIVVHNDPTLMFTNAGMNPFKDIFLGNRNAEAPRVADTQKCLRVSGKHNDLEEVGVDTYHHTMFEMLGNWSFGDYFKAEAIDWAFEFLTAKLGIDKERMYATVFEGDAEDGLEADTEAEALWRKHLPAERILRCNKKDNFWEMGDTGPCGPCSEIHVDLRPEGEREAQAGRELVNADHPQVIEIWNLVFIQFNRAKDGKLSALPARHVDTGMGFERLAMVLQGKSSSYDTDVFQPLIQKLASWCGKAYGQDGKTDIAFRVIVDHIRAVAFTIADGQLPTNNGAGYVVRRILRRAVRYGYSYLDFEEPFFHKLVAPLTAQMGEAFPELAQQEDLITRVINEEEISFLRTLASGLKRLEHWAEQAPENATLEGKIAFELYDTYGFPVDLTRLVAAEQGFGVDEAGFEKEMAAQKARSKKAAETDTGEWQVLEQADGNSQFLGYDQLQSPARALMHRTVEQKKKTAYQVVLDRTPFYAESGGQVGDTGVLDWDGEAVRVLDTKKENDLIVHWVDRLPANPDKGADALTATVDAPRRTRTAGNHSATHLLHAALQEVLGSHVQQKGSYVGPDRLRFDFSHFAKVEPEELKRIERIVQCRIREDIALDERRGVPMDEAKAMGATMLFGEKYGDSVRVITFDPEFSRELCGGTHVSSTGRIGAFRIVSEGAVAAGIRRIEALTGAAAEEWIDAELERLNAVREELKNPDPVKAIAKLKADQQALQEQLDALGKAALGQVRAQLKDAAAEDGGVRWISAVVDLPDPAGLKQLCYDLRQDQENTAIVLGAAFGPKAQLHIMLTDDLVAAGWHAGNTIRQAAKAIQGGGGGQPFYATAGGKKPEGLAQAVEDAVELLKKPAQA